MLAKKEMLGFGIFNNLNSKDLDEILRVSNELNYKPDEMILDDPKLSERQDLFIVLEGRVEIKKKSQGARSKSMVEEWSINLKKGEIFGELGFLYGKFRTAQVMTMTEVKILQIDRQQVFDTFENNPRLGYLLMQNLAITLADRLVDMNFRLRLFA